MKKAELLTKLENEGFDKNIISAFQKVDREKFVPAQYKSLAYTDQALPIGHGQTISQPYTIAFMLDLLKILPGQKIMEVGSGTGYVLALLNVLSPNSTIYGVEIIPALVAKSIMSLKKSKNIKIFIATDKLGLPLYAPFDRILVSATAQSLPLDLYKQLNKDGIMVCPVKNNIIKITKTNSKPKIESFYGFTFVPLIS